MEVEFDLDANGIMHVRATDKATSKEHQVRVEQSSGLDDADIQRMQDEAEKFKAQDEKTRETAEKSNAGDQLVWQARKLIKDQEDRIEEGDKGRIEGLATTLEEALQDEEGPNVDSAMEELQGVLSEVGEKLYADAAAQNPQADPSPSGPEEDSGDQVVDADYEVKED